MKTPIKWILTGCTLFLVFAYLSFGGLDNIVRAIVSKSMVLRSGTFVWEAWRTMPIDIKTQFRIFNITNPDEVYRGKRAILNEMGPYVFIEDWEKVDLSENEEDHTIRFRMMRTYYFQPDLSNGSIDDEVTFINAIFVAVATMTKHLVNDDFVTWQMDDLLTSKGENLTKTATIREILFDGIDIQPYIDLFNNPLVKSSTGQSGLELPDNIKDGRFGLMKGRNGSDDGWFEVRSGSENPYETGQVISHNGAAKLDKWEGDPCNTIRGSDATFFPPYVTKDQITYLYIAAMCRSIELHYVSESQIKGVDTYKFVISLRNWMSPSSNPNNWCFCPATAEVNDTCNFDGVFNLAPCLFGAPIILSQPHFYGAPDWIRNGVRNMQPDYDKHMTTVHFHPLTGAPVEGYARVQFNIELIPYEEMPTFGDVAHAIFPIGWMETGAVMEDKHTRLFVFLDGFILYFGFTCYILMTIGLGSLAAGVVMMTLKNPKGKWPGKKDKKPAKVNSPPPLLPTISGDIKIANW